MKKYALHAAGYDSLQKKKMNISKKSVLKKFTIISIKQYWFGAMSGSHLFNIPVEPQIFLRDVSL